MKPTMSLLAGTGIIAMFTAFSFATTGDTTPRSQDDGAELYASMCATCHGEKGDGDSPVGAMMDPKPTDFTSAEWQDGITDEDLAKLTLDGKKLSKKERTCTSLRCCLQSE